MVLFYSFNCFCLIVLFLLFVVLVIVKHIGQRRLFLIVLYK